MATSSTRNPQPRPAGAPPAPPAAAGSAPPEGPKPHKWWQWMLVYPALVISVLSAVPTYVEAIGSAWLDVPFGQYKTAAKENELWKANIECAAAPFDGLKTRTNVEVDAVICRSGNVLVRVKPPEKDVTAYRWVPLDSVHTAQQTSFLISAAHAQSRHEEIVFAQGNFVVLCQQWVGNGLIRRRIRNMNRCFDEVVNTYTGQVVNVSPAPCSC